MTSVGISVTALAGARGLEEDTLRDALLTLEIKVGVCMVLLWVVQ